MKFWLSVFLLWVGSENFSPIEAAILKLGVHCLEPPPIPLLKINVNVKNKFCNKSDKVKTATWNLKLKFMLAVSFIISNDYFIIFWWCHSVTSKSFEIFLKNFVNCGAFTGLNIRVYGKTITFVEIYCITFQKMKTECKLFQFPFENYSVLLKNPKFQNFVDVSRKLC